MDDDRHARMLTAVKHERGKPSAGVHRIVHSRLCTRQKMVPIILQTGDIMPQHFLNDLVDIFSLAIRLRMVGSRHCLFRIKQVKQSMNKRRNKLPNVPKNPGKIPGCQGDLNSALVNRNGKSYPHQIPERE